MAAQFLDPEGKAIGSTEFAKSVLAQAAAKFDPELAREISAETNWRRNYQGYFRRFTWLELLHPEIAEQALAGFTRYLDPKAGSLYQQAERGFASRDGLAFDSVVGTGTVKSIDLGADEFSLDANEATPDALAAITFLRSHNQIDLRNEVLVAIAGNAELSGAKDWLSWGGSVALIARRNDGALAQLKAHAAASAGTLFYFEEGVDPIGQVEKCGVFVRQLSHLGKRLVFASYGYAPGSKQIELQIAQDAILKVALKLPKNQVAFSWLATPLDVVACDEALVATQLQNRNQRNAAVKLRDLLFGVLGELRKAQPETDSALGVSVFDASANRQGPSYLLAKHSERWRAMVAARQGALVSFTVAPPAETKSVLGAKRILARTYRGLRKLGVRPMSAGQTARLMAGILARNLHDEAAACRNQRAASNAAEVARLASATAVHGGLWALPYRVDSIWVAATVLG